MRLFLLPFLTLIVLTPAVHAAQLHVGASTIDITPDEPVALDGQRSVRISQKPQTRIFATVLALESREEEDGRSGDPGVL